MPIPTERIRRIFGNPVKPGKIWESQFDYMDEQLEELAHKNWAEIAREDLWYYIHDLSYQKLQPELFAYLFPCCLQFWTETLLEDGFPDVGDADLDYALHRGDILNKMLTPVQREAVYAVFAEAFESRMQEDYDRSTFLYLQIPWMLRFNTTARIAPVVPDIWSNWWRADTEAKAEGVVVFVATLLYAMDYNPISDDFEYDASLLVERSSFYDDTPWLAPNLAFLRETVSYPYVLDRLDAATLRLHGTDVEDVALVVRRDCRAHENRMTSRLARYCEVLESGKGSWFFGKKDV